MSDAAPIKTPASAGVTLPRSLNLLQTSIGELSSLLAQGAITSVDLVKAYMFNIEQNNVNGQELRAIIQVAPLDSVLKIAEGLDRERREGSVRGPLHGIPILVKDNIATDVELGMKTTAGSTALQQSVVPGDAEVIKRLRKAGAIILAKANLSELSNFKGQNTPLGWSAVGGQCRSAYAAGTSACGGSSAGNAVGLSAGFGAAALCTETSGSLIHPASRAALYGVRPTTGLVPSDGVVPISTCRDSLGPMGFSAADCAFMLDGMTFDDGRYAKAANMPLMKDLRLGLVIRNFLEEADGRDIMPDTPASIETEVIAVRSAAALMASSGASIIEVNMETSYEDSQTLVKSEEALFQSDFKEDISVYLGNLVESPILDIEDLVQWHIDHASVELPPYAPSQSRLIASLSAPSRDSDVYRHNQAISKKIARTNGLDYIFDKFNLDAAVFAVDLGPAHKYVSAAGYALGTAPLGYANNGVPFGILFAVRGGEEERLISILQVFSRLYLKSS
ncbi:amidase signature domain-containing protein [Dioszegia hungarica]|uniref:Amidase signature domain-containing protein n=1 Tax=Dioszegia hungarica TaxID=4972 RepID=A0AA38H8R8_9TREE|nr:amidase signature domain-containing protein [Dioszegia hungarica]KAI9636078.1 amidase signature domain-containing protein [Dioszegia hungarica]